MTFARLALLAAAAVILPTTITRAADEPAPLPTYAIGHIWPLAGAAHELIRIEDDAYVFAAPNAEMRLTKTLALVSARRGEDYLELIAPAALVWPLKPGDWGGARGEWRASRAAQTTFARSGMRLASERLVWRVEGYEDLALPGGRVRALKILYQMLGAAIAAREVVEWEIAMWYAPSAGVFVKAEDPTFGVLRFELAQPVDFAALRARAGLADPTPPPAKSVDSRRRHRDAAAQTCGALRCATPGPRAPTD
jgi:hypothetical protein